MAVEVVVEYEYKATEDDELTLKVGDIITNVIKQEGGWWKGELNGTIGVFPDNFVKEIKHSSKEANPSNKDSSKSKEPNKKPAGHIAELANKLQGDGLKIGQEPPVSRKQDSAKRKVRANVVYSYQPDEEDELQLKEGDVINVLKQEEEGWWQGELNGKIGMFPSNFVELIQDEDSKSNQDEKEDDNRNITGKKVIGVGLGNIFNQGPIVLRQTTSSTKPAQSPQENGIAKDNSDLKEAPGPNLPSKNISSKTPASNPSPIASSSKSDSSKSSIVETAVVLFPYTAENNDELTLNEGDIITIIDKDIEDTGWWKGKLNGKIGVFPDNFVKLQPLDEKPKKPPPPVTSSAQTSAAGSAKIEHKLDRETTTQAKETKKNESNHTSATSKDTHQALVKKQSQPPPVSKKPTKQSTDPKLVSQTDDHKAKQKSSESESSLDNIQPTKRLPHITASRAKVPNKRPPTSPASAVVKEVAEALPDSDSDSKSPRSSSNHIQEKIKNKSEELEEKSDKAVKMRRPPPPANRTDLISGEPSHSGKTPEEPHPVPPRMAPILKNQSSTPSTATEEQLNTLRKEFTELQEKMTKAQAVQDRRIKDLMLELDEEKKIRLTMQVELDRIKKLVFS